MLRSFLKILYLLVVAGALLTGGATHASSDVSLSEVLKKCRVGDARSCERFADGARFSTKEEIYKYALPGAVEAMQPLCAANHDYGVTSYCHAEEDIQAYFDSKTPEHQRAAAEAARLKALQPAGIGKCAVMDFEAVQSDNGYGGTSWTSVRVLRNNCDYTVEFDVGGQFGGGFVKVQPGYYYQPGSEQNWSGVVRKAK